MLLAYDQFVNTPGTLLQNHITETGRIWTKRTGVSNMYIPVSGVVSGVGGGAGAFPVYTVGMSVDAVADVDFTIAFQVNGTPRSFMLYRYLNTSNYYKIDFRADAFNNVRLRKVVAGADTQIASYSLNWAIGSNHVVRVVVIGNVHTLIIDGVTQAPLVDTSLPSGGLTGLGVFDVAGPLAQQVRFDEYTLLSA